MNKKDTEKLLYDALHAYAAHREELYKLSTPDHKIVTGSDEGVALANELSRILDFISYTLDNK